MKTPRISLPKSNLLKTKFFDLEYHPRNVHRKLASKDLRRYPYIAKKRHQNVMQMCVTSWNYPGHPIDKTERWERSSAETGSDLTEGDHPRDDKCRKLEVTLQRKTPPERT